MASPSTSKRESAIADIQTTLEAVSAGSSYNYTIDKVARIDGPFFIWLDSLGEGVDTAAFVETGTTTYVPETHSGIHLATVEVFVNVARKYEPDALSPLEQTSEGKDTIRAKLIADTVFALMVDHTRGQNARETRVTDDGPVQLDDFNDEGVWVPADWVAHELRFEIDYELNENSP